MIQTTAWSYGPNAAELVTAPASTPVTVDELRLHSRDIPDEDSPVVRRCLGAATAYVEARSGLQLMPATYRLWLDAFPSVDYGGGRSGAITLPRPPLRSVTEITYVDSNGVTQTLSAAVYAVDHRVRPGLVYPAYLQFWPLTRGTPNDVGVLYECGFVQPSAIPDSLRAALCLIAAHLYEHREETISGTIIANIPHGADDLIYSTPGIVRLCP